MATANLLHNKPLVALKDIIPAVNDRDIINERRTAESEAQGRKTEWTGSATARPVAHNGKQLGEIKDRTIHAKELFKYLGTVREELNNDLPGIWGRYVQEGSKRRVEIRTGPIFPNTTGVLSPAVLTEVIRELREEVFLTVCSVWINPEKSGPGPNDFTGRFVANVSVAVTMEEYHPLDPEELTFFVGDRGEPRIGTSKYGVHIPHYE